MNEKVWPKIAVAIASTVLLIWLKLALPGREIRTTTIGEFQQIGSDHTKGPVIIHNASGFRKIESCLVFSSFGVTRIPVVMSLGENCDLTDANCFEGICEGIVSQTRKGDPIDPPFIFVSNVKPR